MSWLRTAVVVGVGVSGAISILGSLVFLFAGGIQPTGLFLLYGLLTLGAYARLLATADGISRGSRRSLLTALALLIGISASGGEGPEYVVGVVLGLSLALLAAVLLWAEGPAGSRVSLSEAARVAGGAFVVALLLGGSWRLSLVTLRFAPRLSVQVRPDGKSIVLEGGLNPGAAQALARALEKAPGVTTVVLGSPGGWVEAGFQVSALIAGQGLNTRVEDKCASACTLAFLSGRERSADPKASLGFHALRRLGVKQSPEAARRRTRAAYVALGLSPRFADMVAHTPSSGMWYPSHDELLAEGILSSPTFPGIAPVFAAARTRGMLAAALRSDSTLAALARVDPAAFEEILDLAWVRVRARAPEQEVLASMAERLERLSGRLLSSAPDTVILEYAALVLPAAEGMHDLGREGTCARLFSGAEFGPMLPPVWLTRKARLVNRAILQGDRRYAADTSDGKSSAMWSALAALPEDQRQALVLPTALASSPATACRSALAFVRRLDSLPPSERARSFRVALGSGLPLSVAAPVLAGPRPALPATSVTIPNTGLVITSTVGPVRVESIILGRRRRGNSQFNLRPTRRFGRFDTIYVLIPTTGSSSAAVLRARWSYQTGAPVLAQTDTIAPTGPANTEFHIMKPSGWPPGRYRVDVSLDGRPAGSGMFEVVP